MTESERRSLRMAVRHFYDIQIIKNQHGGRIDKTEALLTEEDKAYCEKEKKRLAGVEKEAFERVKQLLQTSSFYVKVLASDEPRWKGFKETMAAVLISEVDIERATTVSKLWRYAGLCPIAVLRCKHCNRIVEPAAKVRGCKCDACVGVEVRAERYSKNQHVLDHEGTVVHAVKKANEKACKAVFIGPTDENLYRSARSEHAVEKEKRPFNLFLKTKMLGVLGTNLLRCGNEVWRPLYDQYKQRMLDAGKGTSDGNRHNAAVRYMVKMFLLEIWKEWRAHEGLEVRPTYQEEKLGHKHASENEAPSRA